MKNQTNPKTSNLHRMLLTLYHQDGILDLVVGSCLALLTLVMAFEQTAFTGLLGIPVIFYIPLKEQITIPRMGLIRFEDPQKTKTRLIALIAIGVVVLAALFMGILASRDGYTQLQTYFNKYDVLIFAILVAAVLLILGSLLHNQRFMFYAAISLILIALTRLLALRLWLAVAGLTIILISIGTYKLIRFRRHYSTPASE